jgi:hypothetical protein
VICEKDQTSEETSKEAGQGRQEGQDSRDESQKQAEAGCQTRKSPESQSEGQEISAQADRPRKIRTQEERRRQGCRATQTLTAAPAVEAAMAAVGGNAPRQA